MGETPRTPLGAGQLRGLNQPEVIEVGVTDRNIPRRVRMVDGSLRVIRIRDVWRIDDGWWREFSGQVARLYFELVLENGAHVTLYRDLMTGVWYEQRA